MPTLIEYLGGVFNSITQARVMADLQSVEVAEQYAKHDLLRHFSVPRMRIGDIELTIPVGLEGVGSRTELQLAPTGNDRYKTDAYQLILRASGAAALPLGAARELQGALTQRLPTLCENIRAFGLDEASLVFGKNIAEDFGRIGQNYGLFDSTAIEYRPDQITGALHKYSLSTVQDVVEKQVVDELAVIAETARLRDIRPEDMIRIRLKVGEDGMEWQTIERSDGSVERRLLPE
ncbi:MAG: hypothetical protein IT473_02320 [Lysobacter sp.]|nr:hypothetical protein [Lysobacter sp.]